ncbi:MAG: DUF6580 family putative transport protein [Akkermansiaceae bacterium]|nr:DUF6580 family putative transport protein [Akkermansiaceae bacterium]
MIRALPVVLIIGLLIAFRVVGSQFPEQLPNFQPLAAVFFCGALLARSWKGFAIPAGIWLVTWPLGVGHTGSLSLFATTLASFALIFLLGKQLAKHGNLAMLFGSIGAAAIFHLATNGVAWLADPRYPNTLAGLAQSLWLGAPGDVIPSWVFFRNLAAANFIFTGLFLLAQLRLPKVGAFSTKQDLAQSS